MPQYNLIPIKQVRAVAKMNLNLEDTTAYDNVLDYFIQKGVYEMRNLEGWRVQAQTLIVKDGKAELPCNFIYFVSAQANNFTYDVWDISYLEKLGVTLNIPYTDYKGIVQIEDGVIDFGMADLTEVNLIFVGSNVDGNGQMLIPDISEQALAWYATYRFALKKSDMYKDVIKIYQREWLVARSDIRGDMWVSEFYELKKQLMAIMNALVVTKNSNYTNIPYA
jgi:hypothetical protein